MKTYFNKRGDVKLPKAVVILDILLGVFMLCAVVFGTLFIANLGTDLECLFYSLAMASFVFVVVTSYVSSSILTAEIDKRRRESKAYFDRILSKPQNEDEELAYIEQKMVSIRKAKEEAKK